MRDSLLTPCKRQGVINMILSIFIISLGLAAARKYVEPEYLEALRVSGQDEEFARLMGVDVSLVRPADNEERSAEEFPFTHVSPLGDILLSEDQERNAINFTMWPTWRWPHGRIVYDIPPNEFTAEKLKTITDAINEFNSRVSKVQIVKRTDDTDYITVINGNGCWSVVGKSGGQQLLSLQQNGCVWPSIIHHEFIHAAGFHHEQNRVDRDKHIAVLWFNIPKDWRSQYGKTENPSWVDIDNYDYRSIMHYGLKAPGTNKDAFAVPEGVDKNIIGAGNGMTNEDIGKLNTFYS